MNRDWRRQSVVIHAWCQLVGPFASRKLLIPWGRKLLISWGRKLLIPWGRRLLIPWR